MIVKDLINTSLYIPYGIIIKHNTHSFTYNNSYYRHYQDKAISDFGNYSVVQWCWEESEQILEIYI